MKGAVSKPFLCVKVLCNCVNTKTSRHVSVYYSANQRIGDYQLAKIVECISEPDNLVRSVIVEYTSGKNNKKRTRPVSTASLILIAPSGYTLNEVGEYSPSFNEAWEEDTMAEGRIKDLEKEGKIPPN